MLDFDVVIVGGGAAGLSAALVSARARRKVVVVDAGEPRNAPAAHLHGFLSRDGADPAEFLAAGRAEVAGYGGEFVTAEVLGIERRDLAGFVVRLADGRTLTRVEALPGQPRSPPERRIAKPVNLSGQRTSVTDGCGLIRKTPHLADGHSSFRRFVLGMSTESPPSPRVTWTDGRCACAEPNARAVGGLQRTSTIALRHTPAGATHSAGEGWDEPAGPSVQAMQLREPGYRTAVGTCVPGVAPWWRLEPRPRQVALPV
ncbi:FAD binding domain protein [Kutzneria sp. CA-103260]|nr:FAD binding domain protein [Kutzneria sp. CA-103260]